MFGRKKEKEKPKSWSRKERYLLLSILLITVISSGILALYSRSWKLPGLPRFTIPEEAFQETFVLDSQPSGVDAVVLEKHQRIIDEFERVTRRLSGVYGFRVVDMKTGAKFGIHHDEEFQAASLIKLPMMTLIFEQAEQKRINLDTRHSIKDEEKVGGSGVLYYEPAGTMITNREMVEYMGQYSDNTAFNVAVNNIGVQQFEDYIAEIGMRKTSYESNMTSIRDVSNYFVKLWDGRLVNQDHRDEILNYLTSTSYENHLPSGLPENTRVAHKYGRELHVVNDAGIVFTDNPYVVVIMSKGVVESEADEIFPELSRIIFEGMVN